MASSSRSSRTKYEVFISFRGEDVRYNFLSHLTEKLQQKKIDVYVDNRLERGDEIWPSLVDAIEQSFMSLIIFSKDYASSKWCLKELLKIMEWKDTHGHIVIPIFYHIDPTHVRHQTESYGKAFAEHVQNYEEEEVQSWRYALTQAANLIGFHASNFRNQAKLVEEVAKSLSKRLNRMYARRSRNYLVGIDEKVAELETLMQQRSRDVTLIGIWGMGGIGKTILATEVYYQFCYDYERYYFQANIREESHKQGMVQLRKQIYERLLKEKDLDIYTLDELPLDIKRKLGRTKILLVLDDINESNQLDILINGFQRGSRIIVTTRDRNVLEKLSTFGYNRIYEVKLLVFDDALELFNFNALKENCRDSNWVEPSRLRVIDYANGLPLALKVLGSSLRGQSKEYWKSLIENLGREPFREINEVLMLSYDSLDDRKKTIFLYIVCCFKGYEKPRIIALLKACGFSAYVELTILQDRALITWSDKKQFVSMHALIEEMGREIVRAKSMGDLEKRSHLWNFEDVCRVLQNSLGSASIESIILDDSSPSLCGRKLSLDPRVFAKMYKLKFLKLSYIDLHEDLEYLPDELRLLDWHCYPRKSLPPTFCAKNLVQLIMPWSNLEKLWDGIMPLGNLKEIDLSWSKHLKKLPDFSTAKNLKEVELSGCENLFFGTLASFGRSLISDDVMKPSLIYPGSKVPKWFKYRTSRGSITMTIDPHSKLLGFIFCMILRTGYKFRVECLLENNDSEMLPFNNENYYIAYGGNETITKHDSNHVCVYYIKCGRLRVEESKDSDENNLKLSFKFFRYIDDDGMERKKAIKKCGMYPIYTQYMPSKRMKMEALRD